MVKKILVVVVNIMLIVTILISMFVFSLISPYEFWDVAMECPDSDTVLVLGIYWFCILSVNAILSILNIVLKKRASFVYLVLALISLTKAIMVLTI